MAQKNTKQAESPLSDGVVEDWLKQVSEALYNDVQAMKAAEPWVLDESDSEFAVALLSLGRLLASEIKGEDVQKIFESEERVNAMVQILAYSTSPRALRVLSLISQYCPGFGGRILLQCLSSIEAAEEYGNPYVPPEHHVVYERVIILVRRGCYRRIFGAERRRSVIDHIERIKREIEEEGV